RDGGGRGGDADPLRRLRRDEQGQPGGFEQRGLSRRLKDPRSRPNDNRPGANPRGERMAISMRDQPGTQREFETIFILRPDTNQDGITLVNTRVKGVIEQLGGRVIKLDNWGKRKLAYEVKKQLKGIYLYWQYLGTTGVVEEIE